MAKIVTMLLLGLIIGLMISLIITPVFVLLKSIFFIPFMRKKILDKAIKDGHIVKARLIKSHDIIINYEDFGAIATGKERGLYHYEYNGKTYKFHANSTAGLPDELTLYFIKNPRKAVLADEIGLRENNWFGIYIRIALLIGIAILFVGVLWM